MDGWMDQPPICPPRRAGKGIQMKFITNETYFVASISHSNMVIAQDKHGVEYIAEPTTRNTVIESLSFETPLVYVGRSKELKGPAFRLPDGRIVRGHENNFNLDSEYNKDKMRNRDESNSANVKPEKLVASCKALFATLQARDLKAACQLARELEKSSAQKLADQVVDQIESEGEAEEQVAQSA